MLWEPCAALRLSVCMPASTILQEKRVLELERMKSKAETACKKLERDVLAIKQQKVGLAPLVLGHCSVHLVHTAALRMAGGELMIAPRHFGPLLLGQLLSPASICPNHRWRCTAPWRRARASLGSGRSSATASCCS